MCKCDPFGKKFYRNQAMLGTLGPTEEYWGIPSVWWHMMLCVAVLSNIYWFETTSKNVKHFPFFPHSSPKMAWWVLKRFSNARGTFEACSDDRSRDGGWVAEGIDGFPPQNPTFYGGFLGIHREHFVEALLKTIQGTNKYLMVQHWECWWIY